MPCHLQGVGVVHGLNVADSGRRGILFEAKAKQRRNKHVVKAISSVFPHACNWQRGVFLNRPRHCFCALTPVTHDMSEAWEKHGCGSLGEVEGWGLGGARVGMCVRPEEVCVAGVFATQLSM